MASCSLAKDITEMTKKLESAGLDVAMRSVKKLEAKIKNNKKPSKTKGKTKTKTKSGTETRKDGSAPTIDLNFGENGELIRREECVFSWSADHRVVDGAYVARAAEEVRKYIEGVESMLVRMR